MMTGATTTKGNAAYGYDGFRNRIKKLENITDIRYINDVTLPYNNLLSMNKQNFTWGNSLISGKDYYLQDHLGSPIRLLGDSSEAAQAFDEFGVPKFENTGQPFGFTGYQTDAVSGLQYAQARYYNPAAGRFTAEDPIKDRLNWYGYCNANPINFIDPLGLCDDMVRLFGLPGSGVAGGVSILPSVGVSSASVGGIVLNDPTVFQRQAFNRAISYLDQSSVFGELWNTVNSLSQAQAQTIYVNFVTNDRITFDHPTWTVNWNPSRGLRLPGGYVMSPAMTLAHELGHAEQQLTGMVSPNISIPEWHVLTGDLEDDVINRWETPIARQLGEYTRNSHIGSFVDVETSTDWGQMVWGQQQLLNFIPIPARIFQNQNEWTPHAPDTPHGF